MTVVASDGNDVEHVEVDRLIISVSETYDVIVTIPTDKTAYEFLVTSEDRTKSASLYLGDGIKQLTDPLRKLKYFEGMKKMNGESRRYGNTNVAEPNKNERSHVSGNNWRAKEKR